MTVISEQVGIVEDDIQRLYENWFIETCDPWVVPYIGELLGAATPHVGISDIINRRAFVANTISYRRRKGTMSVLEQLAKDVTGWGAKAVEFFVLLGATQYLNHLRLFKEGQSYGGTFEVRNTSQMELLNSPFDTAAHSLEVRNISNGSGYYNIPNIGIFVWRLEALPVINAPACNISDRNFTFNVLGKKTQLFNHPISNQQNVIQQPVNQSDIAGRISRLRLYSGLRDFYSSGGSDKSIKIQVNGSTVPIDQISVCNLSSWSHVKSDGKIAIDPELGRISLPLSVLPHDVHVSYYYGFSSKLGGGYYDRPGPDVVPKKIYTIGRSGTADCISIQAAISKWSDDRVIDPSNGDALFVFIDSEIYSQPVDLTLPAGCNLEIRSDIQARPTISSAYVNITAQKPAQDYPRANLTINGLLFDKCPIRMQDGDLGAANFKHCTLVPSNTASIVVNTGNDNLVLTLDHTIAGAIDLSHSEAMLKMNDSIIDGQENAAINCYEIEAHNSTIFGMVQVLMIDMISNCILTDMLNTRRRQIGCLRFSYIPSNSRIPRTYKCQPYYPDGTTDSQKLAIDLKVKPRFTSRNYEDPGYAQLSRDCAGEIFNGADDGNEMGAFNHLKQATRLANLKAALNEYTRFGLETGVFDIT